MSLVFSSDQRSSDITAKLLQSADEQKLTIDNVGMFFADSNAFFVLYVFPR